MSQSKPSNSQFDLDSFIPFLINRTGMRVASGFGRIVGKFGLDIRGWRILAALHKQDGQRIGALADGTNLELSSVSRTLRTLEERGYVRRNRPPDDTRVVQVSLLAPGRALVDAIIPEARQFEGLPLDGFSAAETEQLKDLLRRAHANLMRFES